MQYTTDGEGRFWMSETGEPAGEWKEVTDPVLITRLWKDYKASIAAKGSQTRTLSITLPADEWAKIDEEAAYAARVAEVSGKPNTHTADAILSHLASEGMRQKELRSKALDELVTLGQEMQPEEPPTGPPTGK